MTASIVVQNTWYVPDDGTSFIPAVEQIVQEPNCGFDYRFELWYVPDPSNPNILAPAPAEISIDPSGGMIYVEKCLEGSIDPACSQIPISLSYPLVLRAIVLDGQPTAQFVDIPVLAELADPCAVNTIALLDTKDFIDYYLSSPPYIEFY